MKTRRKASGPRAQAITPPKTSSYSAAISSKRWELPEQADVAEARISPLPTLKQRSDQEDEESGTEERHEWQAWAPHDGRSHGEREETHRERGDRDHRMHEHHAEERLISPMPQADISTPSPPQHFPCDERRADHERRHEHESACGSVISAPGDHGATGEHGEHEPIGNAPLANVEYDRCRDEREEEKQRRAREKTSPTEYPFCEVRAAGIATRLRPRDNPCSDGRQTHR